MVIGIPNILPPDGVCKGFVLGKNNQAPFDFGNAWHASNILELVHSDICYINNHSLVGARYVLKYIDDVSYYTWVYLLKNKSHVFEQFKEFRTLDEKQCGQPVKCFISNNGGEYEQIV